jgi:ubiquitin-activating enzyme E1
LFVQVVVCTNATLELAQKYDAFCRAQAPPVPFIYAQTAGVFGQIFCDFGPSFVIFDTNGASKSLW